MNIKVDRPITDADLLGMSMTQDCPVKHKDEYIITINPLPENCFRCPFYFYREDVNDYRCFFKAKEYEGCAIHRAYDCPFNCYKKERRILINE